MDAVGLSRGFHVAWKIILNEAKIDCTARPGLEGEFTR